MQKQGHASGPMQPSRRSRQAHHYTGLLIAILVIGAWGLHLVWILQLNFAAISPIASIGTVLVQAFLSTGLFVTAHDAIHGLVYRRNRAINAAIGTFCSAAYAALSYKTLRQQHGLHHQDPRGSLDPDFCRATHADFWICYRHFMGQYLSVRQLLILASAVIALAILGRLSLTNLVVGWGLPLWMSSIQLFYFGTYCPHQKAKGDPGHPDCVPSSHLPWLWSLLLCYHFSYHQEHHDCPSIPWWQLPNLYQGT